MKHETSAEFGVPHHKTLASLIWFFWNLCTYPHQLWPDMLCCALLPCRLAWLTWHVLWNVQGNSMFVAMQALKVQCITTRCCFYDHNLLNCLLRRPVLSFRHRWVLAIIPKSDRFFMPNSQKMCKVKMIQGCVWRHRIWWNVLARKLLPFFQFKKWWRATRHFWWNKNATFFGSFHTLWYNLFHTIFWHIF